MCVLELSIKPSVSVLMRCFNAGSFLEPAINSALSQPECLELLIADGGSIDSLEKLYLLAASEKRIRIFSTKNNNPIETINRFQLARGTYISMINFNEQFTEGALARATNLLNNSPNLLMVYGDQRTLIHLGLL